MNSLEIGKTYEVIFKDQPGWTASQKVVPGHTKNITVAGSKPVEAGKTLYWSDADWSEGLVLPNSAVLSIREAL